MDERERLRVVLKQLIQNNEYLAENYRKWGRVAATGGLDAVSKEIDEAGEFVRIATQKLKAALGLMGE